MIDFSSFDLGETEIVGFRETEDTLFFDLSGSMGISNGEQIKDFCDHLNNDTAKSVVLDLARVTGILSSALEGLILLLTRLEQQDRKLIFTNVGTMLRASLLPYGIG